MLERGVQEQVERPVTLGSSEPKIAVLTNRGQRPISAFRDDPKKTLTRAEALVMRGVEGGT